MQKDTQILCEFCEEMLSFEVNKQDRIPLYMWFTYYLLALRTLLYNQEVIAHPMQSRFGYSYPKGITNQVTSKIEVTLVHFNIDILDSNYLTAVH